MKRISLGIILPGNPDCVQEPRKWLSIMTVICSIGWIFAAVLCIVVLISAFITDSGNLLSLAARLALVAGCMGLCSVLWGERSRCPFCKHFRTLQKISSETLIGSTVETTSRTVYDNHSGIVYDFHGNSAFVSGTTSRKEYGDRVTEDYTYNMRCKCCGCVTKVKTSKTFERF